MVRAVQIVTVWIYVCSLVVSLATLPIHLATWLLLAPSTARRHQVAPSTARRHRVAWHRRHQGALYTQRSSSSRQRT